MVGGEQLGPATARSCSTSPGGAEVWESPRAITERNGEYSHSHSQVGDSYSGSVEPPPDTVVAKVDNRTQTPEKEEMLSRLVEENGGDISADEKEQLFTLLRQYADVFAASESDLGRTENLEHEVHTGDATPVRQAVRRMPPQRR